MVLQVSVCRGDLWALPASLAVVALLVVIAPAIAGVAAQNQQQQQPSPPQAHRASVATTEDGSVHVFASSGAANASVLANGVSIVGELRDLRVKLAETQAGLRCRQQIGPIELPTTGALGVTSFRIGADTFVLFSNHRNAITGAVSSTLWRWDPRTGQFLLFQEFSTIGASSSTFYTIGNTHFLALANAGVGALNPSPPAFVFVWDPLGTEFLLISAVSNLPIRRWVFVESETGSYLVAPDVSTNNIHVFSIDADTHTLEERGSIKGTNAAKDATYFTSQGHHYLVSVAYSSGDEDSRSIIQVHAVAGEGDFVLLDAIEVRFGQPVACKHFEIDGEIYVAIAVRGMGAIQAATSLVHKWLPDSQTLEPFQEIFTESASGIEYFSFEGDHFLVLTNIGLPPSYSTYSQVLRWNAATREFDAFANIPTVGASSAAHFEIDGVPFLAFSRFYSSTGDYATSSTIRGYNGCGF